jgi:hypothetical protein
MIPNTPPSTILSPGRSEACTTQRTQQDPRNQSRRRGAARVFGSLSVTSSTSANSVKITAAVVAPIHERGLGTFSQPECVAHAVTAVGVRHRNPVKNPIKNATSRT